MAKQTTTNVTANAIPKSALPSLQQTLTKIDLDHFPSELLTSAHPYWLLWSPTPNNYKDSAKPITKILKRPVNPRWQSPDQTLIFEDANEVYQTRNKAYIESLQKTQRHVPVSFGFKYTAEHCFICVDIDDATDDNNELVKLLDSYTEWSPSDKGLHTIVQMSSIVEKQQMIEVFGNGKRNLKNKR